MDLLTNEANINFNRCCNMKLYAYKYAQTKLFLWLPHYLVTATYALPAQWKCFNAAKKKILIPPPTTLVLLLYTVPYTQNYLNGFMLKF